MFVLPGENLLFKSQFSIFSHIRKVWKNASVNFTNLYFIFILFHRARLSKRLALFLSHLFYERVNGERKLTVYSNCKMNPKCFVICTYYYYIKWTKHFSLKCSLVTRAHTRNCCWKENLKSRSKNFFKFSFKKTWSFIYHSNSQLITPSTFGIFIQNFNFLHFFQNKQK